MDEITEEDYIAQEKYFLDSWLYCGNSCYEDPITGVKLNSYQALQLAMQRHHQIEPVKAVVESVDLF